MEGGTLARCCDIRIEFDREDATYRGGEVVSGLVHLRPREHITSQGIRLFWFWRAKSEGSGDEGFRNEVEIDCPKQIFSQLSQSVPFAFECNRFPLSYVGKRFRVEYFVRVEIVIPLDFDPSHEETFVIVPGEAPPQALARREMTLQLEPTRNPATTGPLITEFFMFGPLLVTVFVLIDILVVHILWALFPVGFLVNRCFNITRRLGEVEVTIPEGVAVMGGDLALSVRFTPRKTFEIQQISLHLVAEELLRTENRSVPRSHTLHEYEHVMMSNETVEAGVEFDRHHVFELPDSSHYTFRRRANEVCWELTVRIDMKPYASWIAREEIFVLPATFFADAEVPQLEVDPEPPGSEPVGPEPALSLESDESDGPQGAPASRWGL
jgi:hypothetical protein